MTARVAACSLALLLSVACAGRKNTPPPTVATETAEAEVTRISHVWTSTQTEKTLLSPPSSVSVRAQSRTSRVEFGASGAREALVIAERFDLRAGGSVRCETRFEHAIELRWGRKAGDAAVEMTRPPLSGARSCEGTPPEPQLTEPARAALFVLGADQLVAVEPALEERIYRPVSE